MGVLICKWAVVVVDDKCIQALLRLRQALRAMLAVRVLDPSQEPHEAVLALMDCVAKLLWRSDPASKIEQEDDDKRKAKGSGEANEGGGDDEADAPGAQARLLGMVPSVLLKKNR